MEWQHQIMTARPTPTQQRNSVSQGMAFALLALEVDRLTANSMLVDPAFTSAWRGWAYRGRFPQVDTDVNRDFAGLRALTRASVRSQVSFYWECDRELAIRTRITGWDPEDPEDQELAASLGVGDVPWDGWLSLAASFLSKLDRH